MRKARRSQTASAAPGPPSARAKSDGQAMTARCPAWMRLVGGPKTGHYELIADRAAMVRSWFDKTDSGMGRRSIARDLNARHIATWGQGKLWHDSYIQKTLSNPATYGAFAPRGKLAGGDDPAREPIQGYFPAVVDEETFRKAQATSKRAGHGRAAPARSTATSCGRSRSANPAARTWSTSTRARGRGRRSNADAPISRRAARILGSIATEMSKLASSSDSAINAGSPRHCRRCTENGRKTPS